MNEENNNSIITNEIRINKVDLLKNRFINHSWTIPVIILIITTLIQLVIYNQSLTSIIKLHIESPTFLVCTILIIFTISKTSKRMKNIYFLYFLYNSLLLLIMILGFLSSNYLLQYVLQSNSYIISIINNIGLPIYTILLIATHIITHIKGKIEKENIIITNENKPTQLIKGITKNLQNYYIKIAGTIVCIIISFGYFVPSILSGKIDSDVTGFLLWAITPYIIILLYDIYYTWYKFNIGYNIISLLTIIIPTLIYGLALTSTSKSDMRGMQYLIIPIGQYMGIILIGSTRGIDKHLKNKAEENNNKEITNNSIV